MILVTVGGQVAFDRMIRAVDAWAEDCDRDDVFFQIHDGAYEPQRGSWARTLPAVEFQERLLEASAIVAHAGMGTILTALEHGKPVLVLPRRAALGEQRNDHQLATAEHFQKRGDVRVAMTEDDLRRELDGLDELTGSESIGARASEELLRALREFALS